MYFKIKPKPMKCIPNKHLDLVLKSGCYSDSAQTSAFTDYPLPRSFESSAVGIRLILVINKNEI